MNYADVIEFVKTQTAENGRPPNYEFRSRFEHTMRVYRWAIKLQSKLGGDLDIIVLAALLHDIGWDENRPHGEVGAVSVLWDSMATALEDDASYKRAYYRIKNFYRINKPKIRRCKTDAGRVEYNKRMQLLEEFIFQLEKELF